MWVGFHSVGPFHELDGGDESDSPDGCQHPLVRSMTIGTRSASNPSRSARRCSVICAITLANSKMAACNTEPMGSRQVMRWELDGVDGAVVVVDVIRAFTTAAYAFGAGASAIYLVATVEEALAFKADHCDVLAMGEDQSRPESFDFPNSPVAASRADLCGRTMVQRTSAGTQGIVAAVDATRLWAASLVCASATARAVEASGLGAERVNRCETGFRRVG